MGELAVVDANDLSRALQASVAVRLFGPFTVLRNGSAAALPASRKVRALIAYLVMAPRPIHRDKLCELLWDVPDDPRRAALVPYQSPGPPRRARPQAREGRKQAGVHRYVDDRGRCAVGR